MQYWRGGDPKSSRLGPPDGRRRRRRASRTAVAKMAPLSRVGMTLSRRALSRATARIGADRRAARALHCSAPRLAKILCSDSIDPVCIEIFEKEGHSVDNITGLSEQELCGIIGEYEGLVVRSATKVTPAIMDAATNLKVIGRAGVGIDNINTPEATRRGIMVMNTPGGNTVSTAQLAVSLLCSAARQIPAADASMKSGKWERKKFSGVELLGKTLAIVGESGSGKTTAARIALGAERPDPGGEVLFRAHESDDVLTVHNMSRAERTAFQRDAQMVFQDPYSSLSPRMRIIDALCEPLDIHDIGTRAERREKAGEMLQRVGLTSGMLQRYPHAFSGGQRQRLSIARALMLDPSLLVCDEPTSALDVSVQEQILTLLEDIRDSLKLSYLFISHDLAVVARIADEVAVMRQGLVVEQAPPDTLFRNPKHPYTKALIAAQPTPDINRPINLKLVALGAGLPDTWPEAFRFSETEVPSLNALEPGHKVRCHV